MTDVQLIRLWKQISEIHARLGHIEEALMTHIPSYAPYGERRVAEPGRIRDVDGLIKKIRGA